MKEWMSVDNCGLPRTVDMIRETPTPTGDTEPETVPPKEQQHQYSLN